MTTREGRQRAEGAYSPPLNGLRGDRAWKEVVEVEKNKLDYWSSGGVLITFLKVWSCATERKSSLFYSQSNWDIVKSAKTFCVWMFVCEHRSTQCVTGSWSTEFHTNQAFFFKYTETNEFSVSSGLVSPYFSTI